MKKHNLFKVVGIAILVTVLLTWILPTTYYQYEIKTGARSQVGLFDLFSYPSVVLSYFGNIALYILVIGGFYGILHKIGAYRTLLDSIAKKAKGKGIIILAAIILLLSVFTSVFGVSFGVLMIVPFVVSLVLLMGYDKMTAAMATIGSITVGIMGTTFASTYVADEYSLLSQNGMGIVNTILSTTQKSLIFAKIIVLVIGIALLTFLTIRHALKNYDSKKIEESVLIPSAGDKTDKKVKTWPIVLILDLVFVIILLSQASWTSVFGVKVFSNVTTFLLTKVKIAGFPIIAKILGSIKEFEQWGIVEISSLIVFASMILGLIYRVKFNDYIKNALEGIKKALKPAILVILVYVVLVIVSYNPIVLTITKPLITATKGLNAFTMSLVALITNVFNVDLYYAASSTLQYIASLDLAGAPVIAFIWQTMYGFTALFAPTSVILMVILSYLDISYGKWIKSNWILILGMLACSLITSMVLVLIL